MLGDRALSEIRRQILSEAVGFGAIEKEVKNALRRVGSYRKTRKSVVAALAVALAKSDVLLDYIHKETNGGRSPDSGEEHIVYDVIGGPIAAWKGGEGIGEDEAEYDMLSTDVFEKLIPIVKKHRPSGKSSRDFSNVYLMVYKHRGILGMLSKLNDGSSNEDADLKAVVKDVKALLRELERI